jgi:mRNA-degrading endonuclease RelE of RelBE toxin-antitoxin system
MNMTWVVKRTDTFIDSLRDIRKNKEAIEELDKKLKRLREDPLHVGGWLSGELHGKKSTRISRKYRLIFTPDETIPSPLRSINTAYFSYL